MIECRQHYVQSRQETEELISSIPLDFTSLFHFPLTERLEAQVQLFRQGLLIAVIEYLHLYIQSAFYHGPLRS